MLRSLFFTLTLLSALPALAEENNYTRLLAVMADTEGVSPGYGLGAGYGRKLYDVVPWMSLEAELVKSFAHMKSGTGSSQVKRAFWHVAAYVAFTYPMDRRFSIKGKFGQQYTGFRDNDGSNSSDPERDSNYGMDFGVGALVHLKPDQDVVLEATSNTFNDYTQFIVGMQLHF